MSPFLFMNHRLVNVAASQACWFACVLGAAAGRPWIGPLAVLAFAAAHVMTRPTALERQREAQTMLAAAVIGYGADSVLVLGGWLAFPPHAALGWPSSAWMVALWVGFAATLNSSMGWISGRYAAAALFGVAGGPLAYAAGVRVGAALLPGDARVALAAIAIEWGVAMPVLVWVAGRQPSAPPAPRTVVETR
jgi:hypothetical protein